MALNAFKLKKRSDANVSSRRDSLVFFTDASLGRRAVADALRAAGEEVRVHDELFSPGMMDQVWLETASEKKRVVLTADPEIRHHGNETARVLAARVRAFALVDKGLSGAAMGRIFVRGLARIKEVCAKHPGPLVAHVHRDGRVVMIARGRKRRGER